MFLFVFLLSISALADPQCLPQGETEVSLSSLRPTQPNVGMVEVNKKVKEINKGEMEPETFPVVVGPGGLLYVTDGHHSLHALSIAKGNDARVKIKVIQNEYCQSCSPAVGQCVSNFWSRMVIGGNAYLCDATDVPIHHEELPPSFGRSSQPPLADDPFRTLVYILRNKPKKNPCLVRPEPSPYFWEFRIAEKIRKNLSDDMKERILMFNKAAELSADVIEASCAAAKTEVTTPLCSNRIIENPSLVFVRRRDQNVRGSRPNQ